MKKIAKNSKTTINKILKAQAKPSKPKQDSSLDTMDKNSKECNTNVSIQTQYKTPYMLFYCRMALS